jgi:hypothetical protein
VGVFFNYPNQPKSGLRLIRDEGEKGWQSAPDVPEVVDPNADMAWHPRWGYLFCWITSVGRHYTVEETGPYLIRGPSLDPMFTNKK